jgi:hypothetical protein
MENRILNLACAEQFLISFFVFFVQSEHATDLFISIRVPKEFSFVSLPLAFSDVLSLA